MCKTLAIQEVANILKVKFDYALDLIKYGYIRAVLYFANAPKFRDLKQDYNFAITKTHPHFCRCAFFPQDYLPKEPFFTC